MKKNIFGKNFRKIMFALGCVLLAFAVWFVVEYSKVGASATSMNFVC